MPKRITGRHEWTSFGGEEVRAFLPNPLPPTAPPITIDAGLAERLRAAEQALVRLELAGEIVPSLDWFLHGFVRKEAVLSSQLAGTHATLVDLLTFEAERESEPGAQAPVEIEAVCDYLDALAHGHEQLADPRGMPLSMGLLCEIHRRLMRGVHGREALPGQLRPTLISMGEGRPGHAAFVPPPPQALGEVLGAFEGFLRADSELPKLVRVGLVFAHFETIRPFLRGNGRMGRLLVLLRFQHWKLQTRPLLYLSLYFKRHHDEYLRRLEAVRVDGDWEGWLDFFLDGVATIADEAVAAACDLSAKVAEDRARLLEQEGMSVVALRLFELLPRHPVVTVTSAAKLLRATEPAAASAIDLLADAGVLVETPGRARDRLFAYQAYVECLRAGTELTGKPGG